jgi:protein-tyrosine phosphatase
MPPHRPISLLMVCMGNICRSPTAHGVMHARIAARNWQQWVSVDSCGTHAYHVGEPADARAQQHALQRGYDLSGLRARQVRPEDFRHHDLILAMDHENIARLEQHCPPALQHKLQLLTHFCSHHRSATVPDPYYGGTAGFEKVLDLVEDACEGVLEHLARLHPELPRPVQAPSQSAT